MKRSPLPARTAPPKGKRSKPRRVSVVRDPAYLLELRCNYCEIGLKIGSEGCSFLTDPAHGPVNGMGSKGPDSGAISMCRTHHREQHRIGWPAFERRYEINRAAIAEVRYAEFKGEKS